MDERDLSQSEIAGRAGVSVSTVNAWLHRRRGTGRGPAREKLVALAGALGVTEDEVFAAAGRARPGPLSEDRSEELLRLYAELTEDQQESLNVQLRALARHNRTGAS
ncbi:helix-turn-helix transcriptional regulator [Streptomyces bohaiensis]|uniref:Helix-turn-helix transcriptional regulator n=2 Tax=Streptomyces bohaiensis TaxID=1431344 RepID=A0ABX1CA01_9ACTN|nr:helix-turn-helix transcriptional regulator [Streptomyces bohaiensis]